ncbi:hypothetical protein AAHC03_023042 [Spirometra sp. Aus1]
MLRLFYLLVLIQLSYGCFKWNFFGSGKNANDTAITTEAYGNSNAPSNTTSAPPNSGLVNETSMKPEAGHGLQKQQKGLNGPGANLSVNNSSTGKTTSSSTRSQFGLELFALSLAVVRFLF